MTSKLKLSNLKQVGNDRATKLFNKYAGILVASKVLTIMDINSLAMLSALENKMITMWNNDITPTMSKYSQYKSLSNQFGLNVIARERIPMQNAKKANKFSKT
jgi:hypothetical protein